MLNGSVRYKLDNGFGGSVTAQWQSWQRGNLDDQWHIPAQYLLNASLFYQFGESTSRSISVRPGGRTPKWEVNLDFLNLTNERNWIHNGDAYTASELIFPELPFRMEGYIKIRW